MFKSQDGLEGFERDDWWGEKDNTHLAREKTEIAYEPQEVNTKMKATSTTENARRALLSQRTKVVGQPSAWPRCCAY
jgi:hypothetical protein